MTEGRRPEMLDKMVALTGHRRGEIDQYGSSRPRRRPWPALRGTFGDVEREPPRGAAPHPRCSVQTRIGMEERRVGRLAGVALKL